MIVVLCLCIIYFWGGMQQSCASLALVRQLKQCTSLERCEGIACKLKSSWTFHAGCVLLLFNWSHFWPSGGCQWLACFPHNGTRRLSRDGAALLRVSSMADVSLYFVDGVLCMVHCCCRLDHSSFANASTTLDLCSADCLHWKWSMCCDYTVALPCIQRANGTEDGAPVIPRHDGAAGHWPLHDRVRRQHIWAKT